MAGVVEGRVLDRVVVLGFEWLCIRGSAGLEWGLVQFLLALASLTLVLR